MSNIISLQPIDDTFPVAGAENDTQTFRDNSVIINENFATIKTALQDKVLISANYASTSPVTNDLNGSALTNGVFSGTFKQFNGVIYNGSSAAVNADNGPLQILTLSANATMSFSNFSSGVYSMVRLHVKSNSSTSRTVTIPGSVKKSANFPSPFTVTTTEHVIDLWTYNGTSFYMNYIGAF